MPARDPGPYHPAPRGPHNPALDFLPTTPNGTEGNPAFITPGAAGDVKDADNGGRIPASECRAIRELNPEWRQSEELRAVLKRCGKRG